MDFLLGERRIENCSEGSLQRKDGKIKRTGGKGSKRRGVRLGCLKNNSRGLNVK